ncbi:hypothetical protein [Agromyces ramosus]|nr:hypothetical protein [Agromyces ramosus]
MVLMSTGCAAFPGGGAQENRVPRQTRPTAATPSSSAPSGAPESLGFADGAQLDPLAKVGWQFAFLAADDAAWTSNPDTPPGEPSFVNADDTCTAYYWQENFSTATVDDRSASDEYLAEVSGATADEIATYAEDGYFALTHFSTPEAADGEVASRNILAETDEETWLVAARVFTNLDYTTSEMANAYSLQLACDAGVDPMTQLDSLDEIAKIVVDQ